MKSIKIGRQTYDIKKGDYIMYNGSCYQFITGDKRTLGYEQYSKFSRITSLEIPKSRLKEIPFDQLEKRQSGNEKNRTLIIRWIF